MRSSSGTERLGLALRDAARRLVEQDDRRAVGDDAGEVDDAARAGGELADELRAEGAEPEQVDELVDPLAGLLLGVEGGGQVERGAQRVAHVDPPLERDGDRLLDGERGQEAGVLEGAAQPAEGAAVRRVVRDVDAAELEPAAVGRREARR